MPITKRPLPKKQGSWWVMGKSDSPDTIPSSSEVVVAKSSSVVSSSVRSTPSLPLDQGITDFIFFGFDSNLRFPRNPHHSFSCTDMARECLYRT